jgi:hypothetical protein
MDLMSRRSKVLVALGVVAVAVVIFAVRLPSGVAPALVSAVGFAAIIVIPLTLNQYLAHRRRANRA